MADPIEPNKNLEKEGLTERAGAAVRGYTERVQTSRGDVLNALRTLSAGDWTRVGIYAALEMVPFVAGYSLADLAVGAEAVWDIYRAVVDKDPIRGLRGVVKATGAAIPLLPVSEFAPMLDRILPDKEHRPPEPAKPDDVEKDETPPVSNIQ